MSSILALARLYLLGSLRRQAHLTTLFLGAVLFLLPSYVNSFSLGVEAFERVAKDFGLIVIGYFTVGMALLLGSTAVPHDRETRSIYPVLARPLSRAVYLTAHFLATTAMLAGSLLFLGFCLCVSVGLMLRELDPGLGLALYGSFLQGVVIAAACLMLSIRWSPAVAGSAGAALFLIGHLSPDFFSLLLGNSRIGVVAKAALPDMSALALKDAVVHGLPVAPSYLGAMTFYALGWVAIFLVLAKEAFEEVDL